MNELLLITVLHLLVFIGMTVWIYRRLKRPFTLTDILFSPDTEVVRHYSDADDVQGISIIRWIPGVNLLVSGIWLVCVIVVYLLLSLHWLYENTIKILTDKIIFK